MTLETYLRPSKANELAIWLQPIRGRWDRRYFLPGIGMLKKMPPASSEFLELVADQITGNQLFDLLFGTDADYHTQLFSLLFNSTEPVGPTRSSLRLRLLCSDETPVWIYSLPWSTLCYQNQPLMNYGWTIEWHPIEKPLVFPEYSGHDCHFPDRIIVLESDIASAASHTSDINLFFNRYWQSHIPITCANSGDTLREALDSGSPRLLYYIGSTTDQGLILSDGILSWGELHDLIDSNSSLSLVFLNLITSNRKDAFTEGHRLLGGVGAGVLFQCGEYGRVYEAAASALEWFSEVFVKQVDPVQALYKHGLEYVCAWTHYDRWSLTDLEQEPPDPDYLDLFLDRDKQRKEIFGVKEDFYHESHARIFHAVAYGGPGNKVSKFPPAVKQYLTERGRPEEVYLGFNIKIDADINDREQLDDAVYRQLGWNPYESLPTTLLSERIIEHGIFYFICLHWETTTPIAEVEDARSLMRLVIDWCQNRLLKSLEENPENATIRVISIQTIEIMGGEIIDDVADEVETLRDEFSYDLALQFGELTRLQGVRKADLQKFARNPKLCRCTDEQRALFPDLLLSGRKEMPFEEALITLRYGYPHNFGMLFDQLELFQRQGLWPPDQYDPEFWNKLYD